MALKKAERSLDGAVRRQLRLKGFSTASMSRDKNIASALEGKVVFYKVRGVKPIVVLPYEQSEAVLGVRFPPSKEMTMTERRVSGDLFKTVLEDYALITLKFRGNPVGVVLELDTLAGCLGINDIPNVTPV